MTGLLRRRNKSALDSRTTSSSWRDSIDDQDHYAPLGQVLLHAARKYQIIESTVGHWNRAAHELHDDSALAGSTIETIVAPGAYLSMLRESGVYLPDSNASLIYRPGSHHCFTGNCRKIFEAEAEYQQHLDREHPGLAQCTFCGRTFVASHECNQHVETYHIPRAANIKRSETIEAWARNSIGPLLPTHAVSASVIAESEETKSKMGESVFTKDSGYNSLDTVTSGVTVDIPVGGLKGPRVTPHREDSRWELAGLGSLFHSDSGPQDYQQGDSATQDEPRKAEWPTTMYTFVPQTPIEQPSAEVTIIRKAEMKNYLRVWGGDNRRERSRRSASPPSGLPTPLPSLSLSSSSSLKALVRTNMAKPSISVSNQDLQPEPEYAASDNSVSTQFMQEMLEMLRGASEPDFETSSNHQTDPDAGEASYAGECIDASGGGEPSRQAKQPHATPTKSSQHNGKKRRFVELEESDDDKSEEQDEKPRKMVRLLDSFNTKDRPQLPCPMTLASVFDHPKPMGEDTNACHGTNPTISELLRALLLRHNILMCTNCCEIIPFKKRPGIQATKVDTAASKAGLAVEPGDSTFEKPEAAKARHQKEGCKLRCINDTCESSRDKSLLTMAHEPTESCQVSWKKISNEHLWRYISARMYKRNDIRTPVFESGPAWVHNSRSLSAQRCNASNSKNEIKSELARFIEKYSQAKEQLQAYKRGQNETMAALQAKHEQEIAALKESHLRGSKTLHYIIRELCETAKPGILLKERILDILPEVIFNVISIVTSLPTPLQENPKVAGMPDMPYFDVARVTAADLPYIGTSDQSDHTFEIQSGSGSNGAQHTFIDAPFEGLTRYDSGSAF